MRISDWSSDVCSSDLDLSGPAHARRPDPHARRPRPPHGAVAADPDPGADGVRVAVGHHRPAAGGAVAGVREAGAGEDRGHGGLGAAAGVADAVAVTVAVVSSERSRVGIEWVGECRFRGSLYNLKKKV